MLPTEKVLLEIKRSPLALGAGLRDLTIALAIGWLGWRVMAPVPFWDSWWLVTEYRKLATRFLWEGAGIPASWIAAALGLVALWIGLSALRQLVTEVSRRYRLTGQRVLAHSGVLGRRVDQLYLLSIDGVSLEQSLFGRLFGHASLIVAGRGNNHIRFDFVRRPDEVRDKIDRCVLARRNRTKT
ncbi:PH domain-containing protein [Marinobacterium sediminicola]|uniref:PH domain-containing protein n=1 Tax=Marinobacterium sediminicola TaxID=518898 RepID=A0ABY1S121_9GAMM|nr:PH domain-containing protein [Marinobacterium sediminicola]ULG68406.1 PH domain-containing protein [Marinobacterium sediminicola]SMR74714.1 PH domain-containing protein [Marinobacterium sediminicola]